jgi:peptidoglycan/xylan/chitin deacetylase (PgdA/CDA1 family)
MASTQQSVRAQVRKWVGSPDALAFQMGNALPLPALKGMVGQSVRGLGVSLCLHRVAPLPRSSDWQGGLSIPAEVLEGLIELLLSARPGPARDWLSITFDDGYADAAEWLRTRAQHFPQVEFLFFVCPEKAEQQTGFRWDLVEESLKQGMTKERALELMNAPVDVEHENLREDLKALTKLPHYRLSTVDELRALKDLPNVKLGNHTSFHQSSARTPDEIIRADIERSTKTFERLFGPVSDFAFPFGTPRHHFDDRHVQWLRELGAFPIWTTEARPYQLRERKPQAVLPRFPVDGRQSAKALAGWVAARSLAFRARGTPHAYPIPLR